MDKSRIKNGVKDIIAKEIGVEISEIDDNTSLIDDLEMDSIQILELIVNIEKNFDISLGNEDLSLDALENVNTIVDYIVNHK